MARKTLVLAGSTALLILVVAIGGTVSTTNTVVAATAAAATRSAQRPPALPAVALPTANPACAPSQAVATAAAAPVNVACVALRVSPPPSVAVATGVHPGAAAIQPSIAQTDALTPAFTAADVERYIQSLPPMTAKGVQRQGSATVASVRFASATDVNAQLRTQIAVPATTLLCVADVRGNFIAQGPPTVDKSGMWSSGSVMNHTMYVVFDAHSGDILVQVFAP